MNHGREFAVSFGTVSIIHPHLAELVIDAGSSVDPPAVDELHRCLRAHCQPPFALLLNNRFDYSVTFEAMAEFGNIPECHSIAVVAPTVSSKVASEVLKSTQLTVSPGDRRRLAERWQIFAQRPDAEQWLQLRHPPLTDPDRGASP